jgi:hypothetical protein
MNNSLGNQDCPPLMADGRLFTDYRPSCYVHDLILKQNGITNSYDLKLLLSSRADELQKINQQYYTSKTSCGSCGGYYLPDPNGHVDYWAQYGKWIGYGNTMKLGCPVKQPAAIPTVKPPVGQCEQMCTYPSTQADVVTAYSRQ